MDAKERGMYFFAIHSKYHRPFHQFSNNVTVWLAKIFSVTTETLKKNTSSSSRSATAPALLEVPHVRVGQSGDPGLNVLIDVWIPAFAGMTLQIIIILILTQCTLFKSLVSNKPKKIF